MDRERIVKDLFHAVESDNLENLKDLLNSYDLSDSQENFNIMKILDDKHADINAKNEDGSTLLHLAASKFGYYCDIETVLAIVKLLLENGANTDVYKKSERTPLYTAFVAWPDFEGEKTCRNYDENCRIVDLFLSHGADLNGSAVINGVRTHSPLTSAVISRCGAEFIEYLISKGAEVNPDNTYESTPLYNAIKNGDEAIVKVLLDHGATMSPENDNGESILQISIESECPCGPKRPKIVEQIFRSFYANNACWTRRIKITLLTGLAKRFFERFRSWFKDRAGKNTGLTNDQYKKTLNDFLRDAYETYNDPDLFVNDNSGELSGIADNMEYHCMHESPIKTNWRDEARIVMLLLSNGIDIDFRDNCDKGALCYAIKYGDIEVTKLCLIGQTKVDIDAFNVAVAVGRREIVDILLKHDPCVDINATAHGIAPLLCCALGKKDFPFIDGPDLIVDDDAKDDIAELLVARGADVNTRWMSSRECESVLTIAAQNGRLKLIEYLMRNNANQYDQGNRKPLHAAVWYNQLDAIKVLLRCGADINEANFYGDTALMIACTEAFTNIVKFLLDEGASMEVSFEHMIFHICSAEVLEVIRTHILRKIASSECLSEDILLRIDKVFQSKNLSDFMEKCREEAAKMKSEKIGDSNVCFYDIFEKQMNQLTMYAKNESIRRVWRSRNLEQEFPIHYKSININFSNGMTRAALLDSGAKVFRTIRGCELIPELVIDCLFSYLDDEDIKNLVKAGCNFKEENL